MHFGRLGVSCSARSGVGGGTLDSGQYDGDRLQGRIVAHPADCRPKISAQLVGEGWQSREAAHIRKALCGRRREIEKRARGQLAALRTPEGTPGRSQETLLVPSKPDPLERVVQRCRPSGRPPGLTGAHRDFCVLVTYRVPSRIV